MRRPECPVNDRKTNNWADQNRYAEGGQPDQTISVLTKYLVSRKRIANGSSCDSHVSVGYPMETWLRILNLLNLTLGKEKSFIRDWTPRKKNLSSLLWVGNGASPANCTRWKSEFHFFYFVKKVPLENIFRIHLMLLFSILLWQFKLIASMKCAPLSFSLRQSGITVSGIVMCELIDTVIHKG